MENPLKTLLLCLFTLLMISCGSNPLKGEKEIRSSAEDVEKIINTLYGKNLTSQAILDGLNDLSLPLDELNDFRGQMAEEANRLTLESYEVHSKEIERLKEARKEIYLIIDRFLVLSYYLKELIGQTYYYHDRQKLSDAIIREQRRVTAMVQRDPPLSDSSFSYYKNIDKITSQTADPDGSWFYTIEVNIGYNLNEKNTQTLLNSSKPAFSGLIRSYFSGLTKDYVLTHPEEDVKAGLVMALNDYLMQFALFKDDKMEGVKLVTFDMIQYYEFH